MDRRVKSFKVQNFGISGISTFENKPLWISASQGMGDKQRDHRANTYQRVLTDFTDKYYGVDCMPDERAMIVITNYDSSKGTYYIKSLFSGKYLRINAGDPDSSPYASYGWYDTPCELELINGSHIGKTFTISGTTVIYKLGVDASGFYVVKRNNITGNYFYLYDIVTYVSDALGDTQEGLNTLRTFLGKERISTSALGTEIATNYLNPQGTLTTDRTGIYNVRAYNEVDFQAPSAVMNITDNGVYPTAGYGTFNVNVSSDLGEYFNQNFSSSSKQATDFAIQDYFLKMPPIDCQGKTSLQSMFDGWKLSLVPKLINTSSNTSLNFTFNNCAATEIDVSDMSTNNVTTLNSTFQSCTAVQTLDLRNFNTSKVTTLRSMFNGCNSLETILGIESIDTHLVKSAGSLFAHCYKFRGDNNYTLDLSNWDWTNMLQNTYSSSYGSAAVFYSMFMDCRRLRHIVGIPDLSSNVKIQSVNAMYQGCFDLQEVDLSKFNWSYMPSGAADNMVKDCHSITCLGTGETEATDNLVFTKASIRSLTGCLSLGKNTDYTLNINDATVTSFNFSTSFASVDNRKIIVNLKMKPNSTWTLPSFSSAMYYKSELGSDSLIKDDVPRTDFTLNLIDATHVQYSSYPFNQCCAKTFTLSGLVQSSAQNRGYLFYGFGGNKIVLKDCTFRDQSLYNYLFYDCSRLTEIELDNCTLALLPSNATYMFTNCVSLQSVDLSDFDFSTVTNFTQCFAKCSALSSITLPTNIFQGRQSLNLTGMFQYCLALQTMDMDIYPIDTGAKLICNSFCYMNSTITSFKWDNLVSSSLGNMFQSCTSLRSISLKGLTTVDSWNYTFYSCTHLEVIDLRSATTSTFSKLSSGSTFIDVPETCVIVVADDTVKEYAQSQNYLKRFVIKTAAEYDAE